MDKKNRFSFPAVGGSFLLTIFAVLCLTVFALLSLATAQADARLSDVSVEAAAAYYKADCAAEEILARLRAGELPEGVQQEDDLYRFVCPISDTQALEAVVRLDGTEYTVLRWQAVSTVDWQTDASLSVWDGETG